MIATNFYPNGYIPDDATDIWRGSYPDTGGFTFVSGKASLNTGDIYNVAPLAGAQAILPCDNTGDTDIGMRGVYLEEVKEGAIYDCTFKATKATTGIRLVFEDRKLKIHVENDGVEGWRISSSDVWGRNGVYHNLEGTAAMNGTFLVLAATNVNRICRQLIYISWMVSKQAQGIPGADGVGIESISWDVNDQVTIHLTDGTSYTSGSLKGETGPTGPTGPQGPAGPTGPQGPAGEGLPTGGNEGDVLYKTATGAAWDLPIIPEPTLADEGKVPTVDSDGVVSWKNITPNHTNKSLSVTKNSDNIYHVEGTQSTSTFGFFRFTIKSVDGATFHLCHTMPFFAVNLPDNVSAVWEFVDDGFTIKNFFDGDPSDIAARGYLTVSCGYLIRNGRCIPKICVTDSANDLETYGGGVNFYIEEFSL